MSNKTPLYSKINFIILPSGEEKLIGLRDVNNVVNHQVSPNNITSSHTQTKFLLIKTRGTDKLIELMFSSNKEAEQALSLLQDIIERYKKPQSISVSKRFDNETIVSVIYTQPSGNTNKPSVVVTDLQGNTIKGLIKYSNPDTVTVYFNQIVSGWIYVN